MTSPRLPRIDWPALRNALEQMLAAKAEAERGDGEIVDYREVPASEGAYEYRINAITFINAVSVICRRLAEEKSLEKEQRVVAACILLLLVAPGKFRRAERNAAIREKDESIRKNRFHTPIAEGHSYLAERHELSDRQVRKIATDHPSPLESFMAGDDSHAPIAAALKELTRIRNTLLSKREQSNSGKGDAMRALVVTDFKDIGTTILTEEILDDVDSLIATGMAKKDAYAALSAHSGYTLGKIRTAHQRRSSQQRTDLDNWVATDRDRALKAGIQPLSRDEYRLSAPPPTPDISD